MDDSVGKPIDGRVGLLVRARRVVFKAIGEGIVLNLIIINGRMKRWDAMVRLWGNNKRGIQGVEVRRMKKKIKDLTRSHKHDCVVNKSKGGGAITRVGSRVTGDIFRSAAEIY